MAADARAAAERPDAWSAFVDLLVGSAARMAGDCTFSAGLSHESQLPEIAAAKQEMFDAMDALMARAQAEGRMRAGVGEPGRAMLFAGVSQMLRAEGNRDPAAWRHYAELVANAMRA